MCFYGGCVVGVGGDGGVGGVAGDGDDGGGGDGGGGGIVEMRMVVIGVGIVMETVTVHGGD